MLVPQVSLLPRSGDLKADSTLIAGQTISIQAGQDVALEGGRFTAQDTLALDAGRDLTVAVAESSSTQNQRLMIAKKETLGFGKQSLKTTRDETTVTPAVAQLSAKTITLQAGQDMTLVAPRIEADKLSGTAGGQLTVAAATASHDLKETSEFKTNRFNFSEVTNPSVTGARIKDKIKLTESGSERSAVVAEIDSKTITLQSGSDTTLVAPSIRTESLSITAGQVNGVTVDADARIEFLGVKESTSTSHSKNSHSFVHETVRDGGQTQETLLLPNIRSSDESGSTLTAPQLVLAAPGGIVVGATALTPTQREQAQAGNGGSGGSTPSGTPVDLKAQAQTLAQQPGLAWLGELAKRDDVDWQKIELVKESWDYKHAGLTQEGAVILVIVVTALTWGMGSGVASTGTVAAEGGATTATTVGGATLSTTTAAGATTYTALGAALNAGFSTLASQAAVGLVNNQGDIGKTLQYLGSKETIKQLVSSMLTAGLTQGVTNTFNLPNPSNASFAGRFTTYATKAAISAGVQSVVYGTPLSETAKTALINSLAQTLTSEIGDWGKSDSAQVAKTIAHAVVQCAAASVQNKDCGSAALGAAVAETLSPLLDKLDDRTKAAGFQQTLGSSIAGMGAMLAASLTGQDALTALSSAQMVDNYNRQLHPNERKLIQDLAKQKATESCGGNTDCITTQTIRWTDALERVAESRVDDKEYTQSATYLAALERAAQTPGTEGAMGATAAYLNDLKTANDMLAPYVGKQILVNGQVQMLDGTAQTYFSATAAQRADATNYFLGVSPDPSIIPGMANRDQNRLEYATTANGSAQPVYPVEEIVLGGAVANRIAAGLGRIIGSLKAGNGEGIFAGADIQPYKSSGTVYGQLNDASCAAGSCRMVIAPQLGEVPEAYVRTAIGTTMDGTSLSNIPNGLKSLGFEGSANYVENIGVQGVKSATQDGATVIVNVRTKSGSVHAVVIDSVNDGRVFIRDPWPPGTGSSYSVPVRDFSGSITGKAVVIKAK